MARQQEKRAVRVKKATPPPMVSGWEDDPENGVQRTVPAPDLGKAPLRFRFPTPAPAPAIYGLGTAQFRYWAAAEALRRGADFWVATGALNSWQLGTILPVLLDEGVDLNAYYDRQALNFFHGPGAGGTTVYSCESPDVVCHEMGHAILDAIKPQLWNAASDEAGAFHESFGDMSSILSGLQVPTLRASVLAETHASIAANSRLSRLAEQLGSAIRVKHPADVEPDCLRNAANSFNYQDPATLPTMAPASQLSSEPHSFSRVFTGAFLESLAAMLAVSSKTASSPTEQELLAVSEDMGRTLTRAIIAAPVASDWYAQVAVNMVSASATFNSKYPAVLRAVFVRRAILSLHAATSMAQVTRAGLTMAPATQAALPELALPAGHYGIQGALLVSAAAQPRSVVATAAAEGSTVGPRSSSAIAQTFVDGLFKRGRVEYNNLVPETLRLNHVNRKKSHQLVKAEGGARLERVLFDCGHGFACGHNHV